MIGDVGQNGRRGRLQPRRGNRLQVAQPRGRTRSRHSTAYAARQPITIRPTWADHHGLRLSWSCAQANFRGRCSCRCVRSACGRSLAVDSSGGAGRRTSSNIGGASSSGPFGSVARSGSTPTAASHRLSPRHILKVLSHAGRRQHQAASESSVRRRDRRAAERSIQNFSACSRLCVKRRTSASGGRLKPLASILWHLLHMHLLRLATLWLRSDWPAASIDHDTPRERRRQRDDW